jgi:hypothetical protein
MLPGMVTEVSAPTKGRKKIRGRHRAAKVRHRLREIVEADPRAHADFGDLLRLESRALLRAIPERVALLRAAEGERPSGIVTCCVGPDGVASYRRRDRWQRLLSATEGE